MFFSRSFKKSISIVSLMVFLPQTSFSQDTSQSLVQKLLHEQNARISFFKNLNAQGVSYSISPDGSTTQFILPKNRSGLQPLLEMQMSFTGNQMKQVFKLFSDRNSTLEVFKTALLINEGESKELVEKRTKVLLKQITQKLESLDKNGSSKWGNFLFSILNQSAHADKKGSLVTLVGLCVIGASLLIIMTAFAYAGTVNKRTAFDFLLSDKLYRFALCGVVWGAMISVVGGSLILTKK